MQDELAIVLAAGKGTRMRSAVPKVLHAIAGRSMLGHVIAMLAGSPGRKICTVVAPDQEDVAREARRWAPDGETVVQRQQNGTADAALAARDLIAGFRGTIYVLFGDTPLVTSQTLARMRAGLDAGAHIVVLGFEAADPAGYGRLLADADGGLLAIREEKDATAVERAVRLCNSGVMAFRVPDLLALLDRIGTENAQGEMYLTDIVEIGRATGLRLTTVTCPEAEVMGINTRAQLAEAEELYQRTRRTQAMIEGATLVAPDTVWFAYDTRLGQDVVVEPNVFFGPGVTVGNTVTIKANCHLEGATLGDGVVIGPFARLRPGAVLADDVRIGNFVEVKNVAMGAGAKANHLSYLGDGAVGAKANIGAGTIFCNYDGFNKHQTRIGAGAFVGSNSALVAPVEIGEGAYVASGSVITDAVPDDGLAIARGQQAVKAGWAKRFRDRMAAGK